MTGFSFGEILLLKFPYSEGTGESKRPVLVLAQTDSQDIVVSKITSNKPRGSFDIKINDWKKVGLLFPSAIRVDKLATLSKGRVIKRLGTINITFNSKIKEKIKKVFKIE